MKKTKIFAGHMEHVSTCLVITCVNVRDGCMKNDKVENNIKNIKFLNIKNAYKSHVKFNRSVRKDTRQIITVKNARILMNAKAT